MIERSMGDWDEGSGRLHARSWRASTDDRDGADDDLLVESVLGQFFARYPSAFGSSRAGGYYQVICPQCGSMIAVAAPLAGQRGMYLQCGVCDWEDRLGDAAGPGK
jgi:hypothetical protein